MLDDYALVGREFYAPPEQVADAGRRFAPLAVPAGWSSDEHAIRTNWRAPGIATPEQGWKVHVSARLDRSDGMLDEVARACFAERVHCAALLFLLHHKHGARTQAGKFYATATRDAVDARLPSLALPVGITDPFAAAPAPRPRGPVRLRDYEIVRALRMSNAGGAYEARDVRRGRRVFAKEACAHNGLHWDGNVWAARCSPIIQGGRAGGDFTAYCVCACILGAGDAALDRLHALGYLFGDINPGNVVVTAADVARLIDFEAASPLGMVAEAYVPRGRPDARCPLVWHEYGASALALALLMPLHGELRRTPGNQRPLQRDVERSAPVPGPAVAARRTEPPGRAAGAPAEFRRARPPPFESLERLAAQVRHGLLAMANPEHPERLL